MDQNPQQKRIATKRHKNHEKLIPGIVDFLAASNRGWTALTDRAATACIYFLKRLSKALRASDGFTEGAPLVAPPESRVSRSMDVRAMKKPHRLRRSFLLIRSGISCVHSKRAAVSK